MEDDRVLDVGDVVGDMEVVAVGYKESEDHGRHSFSYTMRLKSEVDAERKAEADFEKAKAKALRDAKAAAKRAAEEEKAHRNTEVDEQE